MPNLLRCFQTSRRAALPLGLRREYAKKRNNETDHQKGFHVLVWLAAAGVSDGISRHLRVAPHGISGCVTHRIGGPEVAHWSAGVAATGIAHRWVRVQRDLASRQGHGL